jgi:hypothetical protein
MCDVLFLVEEGNAPAFHVDPNWTSPVLSDVFIAHL